MLGRGDGARPVSVTGAASARASSSAGVNADVFDMTPANCRPLGSVTWPHSHITSIVTPADVSAAVAITEKFPREAVAGTATRP